MPHRVVKVKKSKIRRFVQRIVAKRL